MKNNYKIVRTTLSATDVDDDVRVGVLGQSLRDDSLAATEGAGDGRSTTLDTAIRQSK